MFSASSGPELGSPTLDAKCEGEFSLFSRVILSRDDYFVKMYEDSTSTGSEVGEGSV